MIKYRSLNPPTILYRKVDSTPRKISCVSKIKNPQHQFPEVSKWFYKCYSFLAQQAGLCSPAIKLND